MSCRAAGVLSHRGLQGIPQRGAARRTCASFPETHIFFRDRFRSPYAKQVIVVQVRRGVCQGAPGHTKCVRQTVSDCSLYGNLGYERFSEVPRGMTSHMVAPEISME